MRYIFKEFEFDCNNLVLSKNGQELDLRHNEVYLLAFLIKHSDKVLSKDAILSHVWKDKVVSEQAVFQNISHLRNILGGDAIKTFPKRGYQWQLILKQSITNAEAANLTTQISSSSNSTSISNSNLRKAYWFVITFIFMLGAIFWSIEASKNDVLIPIEIAYVPIYNPSDQAYIMLEGTSQFSYTALTNLDSKKYQNSIELEYPLIAHKYPFVLIGKIRFFNQQVFLNFSLKGPFDAWHGEVTGTSIEVVTNLLNLHLAHAFIYPLLSSPQPPEVKQASLSIAHQNSPEDIIILRQLISAFIDIGQLDKASVMAEKLANNAIQKNNYQQLGQAYLYQSEILILQKQIALGAEKISLALEQFEKNNDLARQADAWMLLAQLAHEKEDYAAIKSSLVQAAHLSQIAEDIHREVDALAHLSMLAHKYAMEDEKYFYLLETKTRMKKDNLPLYHFAIIPFHEAAFSDSPLEKEPYLLKVLELTVATPNHWMAQSSRLQLMQHYLTQGRLSAANKLIANLITDNARNSYLKALLHKAEGNTMRGVHAAKRTFEQAQMAGYVHLSLDAALLLLGSKDSSISEGFYTQYIVNNATLRWREKRKDELALLKL
jgi:DNA-binding winged helix-turn-helix (wHTH) protein